MQNNNQDGKNRSSKQKMFRVLFRKNLKSCKRMSSGASLVPSQTFTQLAPRSSVMATGTRTNPKWEECTSLLSGLICGQCVRFSYLTSPGRGERTASWFATVRHIFYCFIINTFRTLNVFLIHYKPSKIGKWGLFLNQQNKHYKTSHLLIL